MDKRGNDNGLKATGQEAAEVDVSGRLQPRAGVEV